MSHSWSPLLQHLDPPLVLLALVALCPLYLLYLLFLSLTLTFKWEWLHVHLQMQEWVLCPLCFLSLWINKIFFISWKVSHASRILACGICWPQLLPRTVKEIWGRNPRNPISPSGASHVLAPPPPAPDWAPKVVVGHGPAGALSPTKLPTSFHPCWTWDLCWWRL